MARVTSAGIKKSNLAGQKFGKKDGEEGCHANVEAEKIKKILVSHNIDNKRKNFKSPPEKLCYIFSWPDERGGFNNKIYGKLCQILFLIDYPLYVSRKSPPIQKIDIVKVFPFFYILNIVFIVP
jgi:hypothetical protein